MKFLFAVQSTGGEVKLLGRQVGLVNQASIDASGQTGGGTVLVGGDYQGKNPDVQNARATYIGPEATIRADASATGDGGKAVVWADEGTRFYGTISARGGALGGNGGFVETSGQQVLDAQGVVDASAPAGTAGQWLLDPNNVTIQTAGVNTNVSASPNFTTTNDTAIVTTGSIVTALNAGTSVTVTTASAGANTQAGNIIVANAVAKTAGGNAALTLNATNNITFNAGANLTSTVGQLDVNLNAGAGGITNLRSVNTNGGTLTLDSPGAMSQAGVIAGAGAIVKNGTGTLTLSQNNTYTGATTINAGTLQLGAANRIANASAVSIAAGATFDLNNFNETVGSIAGAGNIALGSATLVAGNATDTVFSGVMSGTGGLTKAGTGMLELSGANTYDGATLVSAGTLVASNGSALGTTAGATTVANAATLNIAGASIGETLTISGTGVGAAGALRGTGAAAVTGPVTLATNSSIGADAGATLTLSGAIGQAGGNRTLTKVGAGTVVLSGTNTYAGVTTVSAGTLTAASAGALGTTGAGTTVAAGTTLNIDNAAIGAEVITLNGTLAGTGVASLAGNVALGAASAVDTMNTGDTLTLTGVVSGANALNKTGTGKVILAGGANNTYTGVTNVNAGTLVAAKAVALGTTANGTTVANGATLQVANVAIGAEAVTLNGTGVGAAGALQGTGTASLTGSVALASASTIGAPAAADTLTLSGVVSGTSDLTKAGSGTVVLAGAAANTYTGATNVAAGTLRVGSAANKIPDASALTVSGGATLDLNGFTETVGSLAGAGNVTLGAATLTAGGNGASTVFSGAVSGGGGLTKVGAGTLELSGVNTYAGATNVNVGTLTASNAAALGTTAGATTVANGATLNIDNVAVGAENVTINGNGAGGVGALTGTGAATLAGQVTVATGARVGAAAGNSLALNGAIQGPGALDVAGGGSVTFGNSVGNLTPLASLTSAAGTTLAVNGTLVRTTGTQTYNGMLGTGGPVTLQTTNANVTASGAVTATAGALALNTGAGNVTMINAANDFGMVAVTSGNTVALNDVNALTLGASSFGTLTATAGGTLSVNGVQTASGAGNSIVLSGTSFVNNAGAGALVVPGGGRWIVYSTDPAGNTFNSLVSGNQAIWNATYAGNPPGTIPAGSRYVFSTPTALTFTSTDASKVYGDVANVSGNYAVTGYVNAATYGNVFTQDNAANAFTGTPSVTSVGEPAIANAGVYPINVTAGSLVSTTGYTFAFNSAGQLTVSARPVTIQANNQSRAYGSANPTTGPYTITSGTLANADSITDINVTSPATAVSGVGPYALTPTGANFGVGTASNYTITFVDGVLLVIASGQPVLPPADNALITASGRNIQMETDAVPPGAVTNVDQCALIAPAPAGPLATAQRTLNGAARGRSLGAPVCENPSQ